MRHKKGYKFTKKKQSARGILSFLLALVSIGMFAAAVFYSYQSKGNCSMYIGSAGIASMMLGFGAWILAMVSLREENSFKLFPYLAFVTSFLAFGIWAALYIMGFILSYKIA